jgi:mRNA interferase HigB
MKVHLIKRQNIEDFGINNARSRVSLKIWLDIIRYADWEEPEDILNSFGSADLLGGGSNRVVFDIAGNHYRLICKYLFGKKHAHLYVCWIGTHAEYDKICKEQLQYTINEY